MPLVDNIPKFNPNIYTQIALKDLVVFDWMVL